MWIRYTVHKRPGEEPTGSLWFTLFEAPRRPGGREGDAARAAAGDGDWIGVGEASMRRGRARRRDRRRRLVGAELRVGRAAALPPAARLDVPGAAAAHEAAAARCRRRASAAAARWTAARSRSTAGAGWWATTGAPSTPSAGSGCTGLTEDGRLARRGDRAREDRAGHHALDRQRRADRSAGERHALGGPGPRVEVREAPERCEFLLPGKGMRVRGTVTAPRERLRRLGLRRPGRRRAQHGQLLDRGHAARVERDGRRAALELEVAGGAAYELGMRERDHGVQIQPFPDG